MNAWNLIPVLLLIPFSVALATGAAIVFLVMYWRKNQLPKIASPADGNVSVLPEFPPREPSFVNRPASWLAIRSRNLNEVQMALGLHNPKPCTWLEGLAGDQKLFLAPPVNGWILVFGSGLPDLSEDVDAGFRFLLELSHKAGQVQFFEANRVLNHHAWARLDAGRVVRAYAWAGITLWNQGKPTRAEMELNLKCLHYFEAADCIPALSEMISSNTEKVPLLAARWSLDPAGIDQRAFQHAYGIAGEPRRLY